MSRNIKNYEVWTEGIRKGKLIIKTDIFQDAFEHYGNNHGSVLFDIEAVNKPAAVVNATSTLRSNERVMVLKLQDGGILAMVEDMAGDVHKVELSNLRFE